MLTALVNQIFSWQSACKFIEEGRGRGKKEEGEGERGRGGEWESETATNYQLLITHLIP
jgi:hypothetical protein